MSQSAMSCWLRRLCLRTTNLPHLVWRYGVQVSVYRVERAGRAAHKQFADPSAGRGRSGSAHALAGELGTASSVFERTSVPARFFHRNAVGIAKIAKPTGLKL